MAERFDEIDSDDRSGEELLNQMTHAEAQRTANGELVPPGSGSELVGKSIWVDRCLIPFLYLRIESVHSGRVPA